MNLFKLPIYYFHVLLNVNIKIQKLLVNLENKIFICFYSYNIGHEQVIRSYELITRKLFKEIVYRGRSPSSSVEQGSNALSASRAPCLGH